MKKLPFLALLLLLCGPFLLAQNPARKTIRGTAVDTSGAELAGATVMLLNVKDTTLVNFTRTNDKGGFAFKNVRNVPYLLKISYISFLPFQQHVPEAATDDQDLGKLQIKPISAELMEVVIRTAKAPLRIHGDTIEYDASTFKVPPGSTVEDLLRRLPGIEVDADGNIKAQGENVQRLYVDGKTFFGTDPKAATKNLGAETLSKVQVYNEKSEQAKLTGVNDGVKEKAMNLELKDEYKKGSFGKLTGAIGTEERWAARGSYNRFNKTQQLSFIGYGNNINETGVNWEDYGEFKGQNSFNGDDNGDFGFNNDNYGVYFIDEDNANFGNEGGPTSWFDGRGLTRNFGAGVNYNFDNKKSKFNANYFYNQTSLGFDQYGFRQTFLPDGFFYNTDTTAKSDFRGNHTIGTRYEVNLDSSNLLIFKADARFGLNNGASERSQLFLDADSTGINFLTFDNNNDLNSWRLSSTGIYRHRFHKKGRSIAVSAGYNGSQSDGSEGVVSLNRFFEAPDATEQIRLLTATDNEVSQVKSSALFTEPISKKWFWETFYNFSHSDNVNNRQASDQVNGEVRLDSLSRYYVNEVFFNRLGSTLRYSYNALNVSAGVAVQQLQLDGSYRQDRDLPLLAPALRRSFTNFTPDVDANYEFTNNMRLNFHYTYSVNEPRLSDLQPVPNLSNPLYRVEGNPDLTPARNHSLRLGLNYWNPANFSNVGLNGTVNFQDNQIIYAQTVDIADSLGGVLTTTRPINVSGGRRYNTYLWSSFPIVKTKLTFSINGNANYGSAPTFINHVENTTQNTGYGLNLNLNATPNQQIILWLGSNLNFNDISYSIQEDQNQHIRTYGFNAGTKWKVISKTFFESNFNYNTYRNDRFGFDQSVPIWNASVRRLFGKQNRIEARLAAFDLLDRRLSISQNGTQNYVSSTVTNTLSRYFMLSLSYNVRGYEDKLKKGWW